MNKHLYIILLVFMACTMTHKEKSQLEIAKRYYGVLDRSGSAELHTILADSLLTIDDGYKQRYSVGQFKEWLEWDASFDPNYEILNLEFNKDEVRSRISKVDKRILFLHGEPIVTEEIIRFQNNKIQEIERKSAVFHVQRFVDKRDSLVAWISKNNPELNAFINDQTKIGAVTYLKAIELYQRSTGKE